ncbi:hypothetical protein UVI_02028890 [Ustilaginoidea virens]|uniref:Uncharacterized protein n=1 Tax=Ustilaginoidea virens TaxID=1159556 RepID=A0A1B5KX90_USTVR|nr:hypothetical protein UVI_02028890 [Ustilaginoidea virens]
MRRLVCNNSAKDAKDLQAGSLRAFAWVVEMLPDATSWRQNIVPVATRLLPRSCPWLDQIAVLTGHKFAQVLPPTSSTPFPTVRACGQQTPAAAHPSGLL